MCLNGFFFLPLKGRQAQKPTKDCDARTEGWIPPRHQPFLGWALTATRICSRPTRVPAQHRPPWGRRAESGTGPCKKKHEGGAWEGLTIALQKQRAAFLCCFWTHNQRKPLSTK